MTFRTIRAAALELGVTPRTIRNWLAAGAPYVPGKRRRVDPVALRIWRQGGMPEEELADKLLHLHRREAIDGRPAHEIAGIPSHLAAFYLCCVYDTLVEKSEPPYPEAIEQLRRLAGAA